MRISSLGSQLRMDHVDRTPTPLAWDVVLGHRVGWAIDGALSTSGPSLTA